MLIIKGLIFFFICVIIGIWRGYKNVKKGEFKSEFYILDSAEVIIFGFAVIFWCGWFEEGSTMPIAVPLLVTGIFLFIYIGKKVKDGQRVKEEKVDNYWEEKSKKWNIEETKKNS